MTYNKVIATDKEHKTASDRFDKLLNTTGSNEEIKLLALLIDDYERRRYGDEYKLTGFSRVTFAFKVWFFGLFK